MIDTLDDMRVILSRLECFKEPLLELSVPGTRQKAYAFEVFVPDTETTWKTARTLVSRTGRWPIISTLWNAKQGFVQRVEDEDIFSRFYFEEAPNSGDVRPASIIERSHGVDASVFAATLRADFDAWVTDGMPANEILAYQIEQTRRVFGVAPEPSDYAAETSVSELSVEKWLFDWESANAPAQNARQWRVPWFTPENALILFLPTASSWESLAYLNWFGTSDFGTEKYIALGKYWEKEFGAELVCHYGTMLQCLVSNPPQAPLLAYDLALQHVSAGRSTSGGAIRHYSRGLVGSDRWFLHDRP